MALPLSAEAYERAKAESGAALHYDADTLDYDVVFGPETQAFSSDTREAFDVWGHAMRGHFVPRYLGPAAASDPSDRRSTVELVTRFDFDNAETTIAHTFLFYDTISGLIIDADITLNGEHFHFSRTGEQGAFDQQSVIVHEIGHALGLAHTCGVPGTKHPSCFGLPIEDTEEVLGAIMSPSLSVNRMKRALRRDDVEGIEDVFAVSSTRTVPKFSVIQQDCELPDSPTMFQGDNFLPEFQIYVREVGGAMYTSTTATIASVDRIDLYSRLPENADLLIIDPKTRAYHSSISPPVVCELEPFTFPKDENCACSDINAGGRQFPFYLPMIILMALLAARRARLVLFLVAILLPAEAWAYKCSRVSANVGPSLFWDTRTIPWVAHATLTTDMPNDTALEQLRLSFSAWQDVDCSDMELPFMGQMGGLRAGYVDGGPNQNVVLFFENAWPYDRGVIAVTTNAYETRSGRVLDSDIEINGEQFTFVVGDDSCRENQGEMDLRNAITHEVGHVLGLDHPPIAMRYAGTTMYASAPPCEIEKRSLADDDIEGLCTIYPLEMETHQCYPPDGPSFVVVEQDDGFGGCRAAGTGDSWALYFAALVIFAILRRRA